MYDVIKGPILLHYYYNVNEKIISNKKGHFVLQLLHMQSCICLMERVCTTRELRRRGSSNCYLSRLFIRLIWCREKHKNTMASQAPNGADDNAPNKCTHHLFVWGWFMTVLWCCSQTDAPSLSAPVKSWRSTHFQHMQAHPTLPPWSWQRGELQSCWRSASFKINTRHISTVWYLTYQLLFISTVLGFQTKVLSLKNTGSRTPVENFSKICPMIYGMILTVNAWVLSQIMPSV